MKGGRPWTRKGTSGPAPSQDGKQSTGMRGMNEILSQGGWPLPHRRGIVLGSRRNPRGPHPSSLIKIRGPGAILVAHPLHPCSIGLSSERTALFGNPSLETDLEPLFSPVTSVAPGRICFSSRDRVRTLLKVSEHESVGLGSGERSSGHCLGRRRWGAPLHEADAEHVRVGGRPGGASDRG